MTCKHCNKQPAYTCTVCGAPLCPQHTQLRTLCPTCQTKTPPTTNITITEPTTNKETNTIRKLVQHFWGEQEQLTFNKTYTVAQLPAYIAKTQNNIIAFISYVQTQNATTIVALAVLPEHQNTGIAKALIKKLETQAKRHHKKKLLVSTSNDDLPALAFYQSLCFQITQVKPNAIAEKHGKTVKGINGIPVRDEIRLQKTLT